MSERKIWMWNEWGHPWPLWDDAGPLDPESVGLTRQLGLHLREWHSRWEFLATRDIDWRWGNPEAQPAWEQEGDRLFSRLEAELGARAKAIRAFRFPDDEHALQQRGRRSP